MTRGSGAKAGKGLSLALAAACVIGACVGAARGDEAGTAPATEQASASKPTGHAVLSGFDVKGHQNLWVTDGTAAGTRELTVTGASRDGLFAGDSDPHFTAFGNRMLFAGFDARTFQPIVHGDPAHVVGIWVTDGTSAGTRELNVAGAYRGGVVSPLFLDDPDLTVFRHKVLFRGLAGTHIIIVGDTKQTVS